MNVEETTKEREDGANGEVETAEERSAADEEPACGCCGGTANKQ